MARILVIDDDRDFRNFVAAILKRRGHEVIMEGSSQLFVRSVNGDCLRDSIDVAIVDIMMPTVSGIGVIRSLKESLPSTRIVAMTGGDAHSGVEARLELAKLNGAKGQLTKPFTSRQLCAAVRRVMEAA